MNVFVTGVNGFVGRALAAKLTARGHRVSGSVSVPDKVPHAPPCEGGCRVLRLNEEFDPTIFRGVDAVVHCAHDFGKNRSEVNREGTKKIARAADGQGVAAQVFVGSYSAHERATSEYGKTKLELEQFFSRSGHTVAKPGLVIGDGGIYSKMCALFGKYPLLPLVGGGQGKVPIVGIRDLTDALAQLVERPRPGVYSLHRAELITLEELFRTIKSAGNFKTVFIPVPFAVVDAGARLLARLGVGPQIDGDNLKGFRANQYVNAPSDLGEFIAEPLTLDEMVRDAAAEAGRRPRR